MLGLVQTTGFNSVGQWRIPLQPPSSRRSATSGRRTSSWQLAAPAVLVLLLRGDQLQRMLGLLYCAAGVTLAYAVFLGTLEEQELYLLLIPSLLVIPVAATLLLSGSPRAHRSASQPPQKLWIATMGAALTIALGVNLLTCVRWLLQPDDGFAQLIGYVTAHVPAGTAIGSVYGDIETLYGLAGYQVGYWETKLLSQGHVRYFVVEWALSSRATQTRPRPRSGASSAMIGWCSRSRAVPMASSCCTSFRAEEDSSDALPPLDDCAGNSRCDACRRRHRLRRSR